MYRNNWESLVEARDNWAKLVEAVVRRQKIWQMFHDHSRSPSISTIASEDDDDRDPTNHFSRQLTIADSFKALSVSRPDPLRDPTIFFQADKVTEILQKPDLDLIVRADQCFRPCQSSGKKCYTSPAKELSIAWKNDLRYWELVSLPESRFGEVARLQNVCWLDICGTFHTKMLSPNTNYAAYLLFKLTENYYGFQNAVKASIKLVKKVHKKKKLVKKGSAKVEEASRDVYLIPSPMRVPVRSDLEGRVPCRRADGWMEIQLGEFFINGGGDQECDVVKVQLCETQILNWKCGLIVEGIELRPKEEACVLN